MTTKFLDMIYYDKLSDYGRTFYNYLFTKPKNVDKQILDPLTTVIKLALLYFYESGTKLTIYNNSITLHPPDILQGAIRTTYSNSRNTLYNIKEPIINCMTWFPYSRYPDLKTIYSFAIKGLEKLKENYDGSICDSIDNYITIINNNLNLTVLDETIILQDKLQSNIKKIWNVDEIKLINNFFIILNSRYETKNIKNIENENNKGLQNIINSILCFLNEKDENVVKYLKTYITNL
jgi:hypothetical protein